VSRRRRWIAGYRLAIASTALAVVATMFVIALGMGFGQRTDRGGEVVVGEGTAEKEISSGQAEAERDGDTIREDAPDRRRGVFAGFLFLIAIFGIPIAISGVGVVAPSRRSALIVRSCAAVVLLFWAFLFAFSASPFYMLATGLMVAAVVLAATTSTDGTDNTGAAGS
jgi:hypothetical protein